VDKLSEILEKITLLDEKMCNIELLLRDKKLKNMTASQKKRVNIPEDKMTPNMWRLKNMMLISGKSRTTMTYEEYEALCQLTKSRGAKVVAGELQIMERFWSWNWVWDHEKDGNWWTDSLITLINQWSDKYVPRSVNFIKKHGDVPAKKKKLPMLNEPEWEWRLLHEKLFGSYPPIWNMVSAQRQHELIQRRQDIGDMPNEDSKKLRSNS
jgi:hypothetical protein